MKVYTSYYAKVNKLPAGVVPISISSKAPFFYKGLEYKKIAPKYWFLMKYKEDHDEAFYTEQYYKEVLSQLDPVQVLFDLQVLSEGKDVALLCYERPADFCHKHLVANWLTQAGIVCEEIIC